MATEFSNIDFGFRYGTQSAVDTTNYLEGTFNVATDTGELYIDIGGSRVSMNKDIHLINTEVELRAIANPTSDRVYYTKDTKKIFVYSDDSLRWINIGGSPDETNARIDNLVQVVNSLHSFEIILLESIDDLPEIGKSNIIYFVPQSLTLDADTKYDEFVWISDLEYYEKIGITEADLGDYYKKSEIDAVIGTGYITDPSDVNYKGTVSNRLDASETGIATLNAEIGTLDPTVSGYVPVAERLSEIEAKIGSTMDPSSTAGFKSIENRLDTLETSSGTHGDDVGEIKAKLGSYPNSNTSGFVSIEDRFETIEQDLSDKTTSINTVNEKVDDVIDDTNSKLGTMDPTVSGFKTVEERLHTLETTGAVAEDVTQLVNIIGEDYPDPSDPGFATIQERLTSIETVFDCGDEDTE